MDSEGRSSIVILAGRGDAGAVALAAVLRRRGVGRVEIADGRALVQGVVRHRPDSGAVEDVVGSAAPLPDRLRLPSGVVVDRSTDVVLCRLPLLAAPRFADRGDREYAEAEVFALALSWLHGLGDAVVNPPSPRGLAGDAPDLLALHRLAAGVGLPVAGVRLRSNGAAASGRAGGHPDARVGGGPSSARSEPGAGGRWQRWDGVFVPVTASGGAVDLDDTASAAGPPLPMPTVTLEPTTPVARALVCDGVVVGAPAGVERATAELVRVAGLRVAEVTFGVPEPCSAGVEGCPGDHRDNLPHSGPEAARVSGAVVLSVDPVPGLQSPGHLDAMADYVAARARSRSAMAGSVSPGLDGSRAGRAPHPEPAEVSS